MCRSSTSTCTITVFCFQCKLWSMTLSRTHVFIRCVAVYSIKLKLWILGISDKNLVGCKLVQIALAWGVHRHFSDWFLLGLFFVPLRMLCIPFIKWFSHRISKSQNLSSNSMIWRGIRFHDSACKSFDCISTGSSWVSGIPRISIQLHFSQQVIELRGLPEPRFDCIFAASNRGLFPESRFDCMFTVSNWVSAIPRISIRIFTGSNWVSEILTEDFRNLKPGSRKLS